MRDRGAAAARAAEVPARVRWSRAFRVGVLALAALAMVAVPAGAHWEEQYRQSWAWGSLDLCVQRADLQNHTYHSLKTVVWGRNCGSVQYLDANNISNYKMHYKVHPWGGAEWCLSEGWMYNPTRNYFLEAWRGFDIWQWCNFGSGVHVTITMDGWHYAKLPLDLQYKYPGDPWKGTSFRPSTQHCHCP